MKRITLFSLALIFALIKNGYSEAIIATESFVRDGLASRVTNDELTTIITAALATKSDLLVGAVEGNVATVNATGQYIDSGTALSSLAVAADVTTSLATKADLQTGATAGNVATMSATGQYVDSGSALSSLATTANVNTGLDTKLSLTGGTMSGPISMGNNSITNLTAPTNTDDATTKAYVDAYHTAPSWSTLSGQNWSVPGWGGSWQVNSGSYTVYGVAACLQSNQTSGNVPASSNGGGECWCKVTSINGIEASGAWSYNSRLNNTNTCFSRCTFYCSLCVRNSSYGSCSRSALFSDL